jgi:hypothetical protein
MYIKITNEKHKYYGQYFDASNNQNNFICNIDNTFYFPFDFNQCEEVVYNHEKKRAYWKWKRFKTTFLMHKFIEGSEFTIDKWGTPNIKYKNYSFCFFNDSKKWGIFMDNRKIKLLNKEELIQWITAI